MEDAPDSQRRRPWNSGQRDIGMAGPARRMPPQGVECLPGRHPWIQPAHGRCDWRRASIRSGEQRSSSVTRMQRRFKCFLSHAQPAGMSRLMPGSLGQRRRAKCQGVFAGRVPRTGGPNTKTRVAAKVPSSVRLKSCLLTRRERGVSQRSLERRRSTENRLAAGPTARRQSRAEPVAGIQDRLATRRPTPGYGAIEPAPGAREARWCCEMTAA